MKKTTSIIVSLLLIVLTMCMNATPAFAETTSKYWEPITNIQDSMGCVNDNPSSGIYTEADDKLGGIKIIYHGEGRLTGWELPLLEEGKDYKVLGREENSITVELINGAYEIPYINALVDFGEEQTTAAKAIEPAAENNQTPTLTEVTTGEAETGAQTSSNTQIKALLPYLLAGAGVIAIIAAIIIAKKK